VTYGLGACIALVAHDPERRVGGMIHFMLPFSSSAVDKARERPAMFGDTGIPLLLERIAALGARREALVLKAAGGGLLHGEQSLLRLGQRNHTALRKILWKHQLLLAAEDIGGTKSRTVRLHLGTGRVTVTSLGVEEEL
jgi:chemotaxis protein CheD